MSGQTNIPIDTAGGDRLIDTEKVTAGYFSGGAGRLDAASIHTGTLADSNEKYYFNVNDKHPLSASSETQFSIAYGHIGGSGSKKDSGDVNSPTQAIYGQWATSLLGPNEISGGFRISTGDTGTSPSSARLSVRDPDIYILVGKRARYKDRWNKKNWTMALTGSTSGQPVAALNHTNTTGSNVLYLTDDSANSAGVGTAAGVRYNIVSGSGGTVVDAASVRTFGWFYPEVGVMVFSAAELSASIPGEKVGDAMTASFALTDVDANHASCSGFSPNLDSTGNSQNALRFVNCLGPNGAYLMARSEEDQTSISFFCRVPGHALNFSNNPTWVSGSYNEMYHQDMYGNPIVYLSGIGLYNSQEELVAVGRISTPLKKNFSSEATIKVRLTY